MQAILAIALQTARSAFRSKVFFLIMLLTVIATTMLPASIIGDASLSGEFRIRINYSIGVITFLIGLAGLWLSTINIATEIEGYQVHMVLTKPVSSWKLWLGKFFGIAALCFTLLAFSAAFIYFVLTNQIENIRKDLVDKSIRLLKEAQVTLTEQQQMELAESLSGMMLLLENHATQPELKNIPNINYVESPERIVLSARMAPVLKKFREYDDLKNEVLVGRNHYRSARPNFYRLAKEVLEKSGQLTAATPEDVAHQLISEQARIQESKHGALPIIQQGQPIPKVFWFEDFPPLKKEQAVYIKCRTYAGDPLNQTPRNTMIGMAFVDDKGEGLTPIAPFNLRTTEFFTERVNPLVLEGREKFGVALFNLDHEVQHELGYVKELIIQAQDGPLILVGETSFAANYWRCMLLISLFILFLIIVGLSAGCCFSTPVAILFAVAYIFIGVAVSTILNTEGAFQVVKYEGQLAEEANTPDIIQSFHRILNKCMVTVDTFTRMEYISTGRAITWQLISEALLFDFMLKGFPIVFIGMYVLQRRELGLVVRK